MTDRAYYSAILDCPAAEAWAIVRDFNSYPDWVEGVDDSHIEGDLPGTTTGAVRNFSIGGVRIRQRLLAHSDLERSYTFEGCGGMTIDDAGTLRELHSYRATVRLTPIVEEDRCLVEWTTLYACPAADASYWAEWWESMVPSWVGSLKRRVGRRVAAA